MVHVLGGDDVVLHEHRGRDRPARQDVERQPDQPVAVALGEVAHRPHERRARLAQLGARVGLGVLAHDRAASGASRLLEGAHRSERARIVGRAHQHAAGARRAEVLADALERGLELPVAVDRHARAVGRVVQDLADARHHTAQPRVRQRPRARQLDEDDLVHLAAPALAREAPEAASGQKPRLVVVGAEVGGSGVRDVDRDHRNPRLEVARGDGGGDRLVGLELDHEVDAFPDQELGVAQRRLRLVAVVHHHQLDVLALGRRQQARAHLARERARLALVGVADAVAPAAPDLGGELVAVALDALEEAAVVQRVQQPEAEPLGEARALHHVAQPQRLSGMTERPQHVGRVQQRLDEVAVAIAPGGRPSFTLVVHGPRVRGGRLTIARGPRLRDATRGPLY